MDSKLREELVRDECLGGKPSLKAYRDTNGFWTIGVGHLLGKGVVPRVAEITAREAFAWLTIDVEDAETLVRGILGPVVEIIDCTCSHKVCDADRVRWRALVNMAFNRGGHMKTSTTITPAIKKALMDGDWRPVKAAIEASQWAKQVGVRAVRLARMLEKGEDA